MIIECLYKGERCFDIVRAVERCSPETFGFFCENMRGVEQDKRREVLCRWRHIYLPAKAVSNQFRNSTNVVKMRMRHDESINCLYIIWKWSVPLRLDEVCALFN